MASAASEERSYFDSCSGQSYLTPGADSGRGKGDRVNVRVPGTPPEDVPRGKGDKGKLQSPVTPEKGASKGIPRVPGANTLTAPDASERLGNRT